MIRSHLHKLYRQQKIKTQGTYVLIRLNKPNSMGFSGIKRATREIKNYLTIYRNNFKPKKHLHGENQFEGKCVRVS